MNVCHLVLELILRWVLYFQKPRATLGGRPYYRSSSRLTRLYPGAPRPPRPSPGGVSERAEPRRHQDDVHLDDQRHAVENASVGKVAERWRRLSSASKRLRALPSGPEGRPEQAGSPQPGGASGALGGRVNVGCRAPGRFGYAPRVRGTLSVRAHRKKAKACTGESGCAKSSAYSSSSSLPHSSMRRSLPSRSLP